jgi:predicted nucleic acid-binding protein
MVLFDATALSLLLHPEAKPPVDRSGKPVSQARERIELLVETLDEKRTKVIIPTPALAELLVIAGPAGPKYLNELNSRSCFRIVEFDQRAAIEAAIEIRRAIDSGDKKEGSEATWGKVKFDRQIVAIAKVENATAIYSDDEDVSRYAQAVGIQAIGTESLPFPQPKLFAERHEAQEKEKPREEPENIP